MASTNLSSTRPLPSSAANKSGYQLLETKSNRVWPIDRSLTIVGRGPDADIRLDDECLSGNHCRIFKHEKALRIRDLTTKNGTAINGVRILEAELAAGDRIAVGRSVLEIAIPESQTKLKNPIVGQSPQIKRALDIATLSARARVPVLILGETGTGKELFARHVHLESRRSKGPFVAFNCATLPKDLVASELFGFKRGAFTNAERDHKGIFSQAHQGTLFLDEIGELSQDAQTQLLRTVESGTLRPLGSDQEVEVDVRIVAATNRLDLGEGKRMRSDLFHRLASVVIELPPLRERRGDIPLLVEHFLKNLQRDYGVIRSNDDVPHALSRHRWPGNIRELRQSLERAIILGRGTIRVQDLVLPAPGALRNTGDRSEASAQDALISLMDKALREHNTMRQAAASLGMAKSTFAARAQRFGLKRLGT